VKFDRNVIKDLAIRNLQYDTNDPIEAVIWAIETWMGRHNLILKAPDEKTGEAPSNPPSK